MSRAQGVRAFYNGRAAAAEGRQASACPYDDSDDAGRVERFLRRCWMRGFGLTEAATS